MRKFLKELCIALSLVCATAAVAAINVNPSHHSGNKLPLPPNFSTCDFKLPTSFNNVWYIDPVNGQTGNAYTAQGIPLSSTATPRQGDINHPWKDFNALSNSIGTVKALGYAGPLIPDGIIKGGDEVLLQSGTAAQYGNGLLGIAGYYYNTKGPYITIQPAPGATVTFTELYLGSVNYVAINGVNVQSTAKYPLVKVSPGSNTPGAATGKNVILNNLTISSTDHATALTWTQAQWASASNGLQFTSGPCTLVENSHIFNVGTGVGFTGGTQIQLLNNEVSYIAQDGIDFDGLDLLISGNYVHDFPNAGAGDHIDGMQGVAGIPSIPYTRRVTIANNTVIWQVDPNLPFPTGSAINGAIDAGGCCWTDYVVNNNKISWPNYVHGISMDHCTTCMIENNTLMEAFIVLNGGDENMIVKNNLTGGLDCKNGDQAGVQMIHNIMYHNGNGINILCYGGVAIQLTGNTPKPYIGNNFSDTGGVLSEVTAYNLSTFTFDFHLISTAPARGAGVTVDFIPAVDSNGVPLNNPPDIGAVAFPEN